MSTMSRTPSQSGRKVRLLNFRDHRGAVPTASAPAVTSVASPSPTPAR